MRRPFLDPATLRHPDRLGVVLGDLFAATPGMVLHRRRIIRLQRRLRKLVTDEAWSAYLTLESTDAGRFDAAVDLVAQWAFLQGRRRQSR